MSKLLIRKVTTNGHLLSVKRSNPRPATAALEKEMQAPYPHSPFKRQRTESAVLTSFKRNQCFDNLTDLFDEASLIEGSNSNLFPKIEWSSVEDESTDIPDVTDSTASTSHRQSTSLPPKTSLKRQIHRLHSPCVLNQLHEFQSRTWQLEV
ncbi:hypothetical protein MPSEU_000435700 [Mayamaea pseudoterrestris]|nr:hypothetical protein MPSEU_000435700 [Mayamaea pseudoterrestris]